MSFTELSRKRKPRKEATKDTVKQEIKEESLSLETVLSAGKEIKSEESKDEDNLSKRKRKSSIESQECLPKRKTKSEKPNKVTEKARGKKNVPSESKRAKTVAKNGKSKKETTSKKKTSSKNDNQTKEINLDSSSDEIEDEKKAKVPKKSPKKKSKVQDDPVPRPLKYESLGEGPLPVPSTGKMYIGCHVSGAGGVWNAFANADECEAESFALFLRSQRQWVAKPLDDVTVEKWQKAIKDMPPHLILPHGSYLMNLGSPNEETLKKSRQLLLEELQRCEKLGIPHYNFHPGSTTGKTSRENCCKTIAESINISLDKTKGVICVLENMSCQGFTIGGDFHELRTIIEHVTDKTRVGVCLDTCHTHAAGYDLSTEAGFKRMLEDFGKIVGWQFLRALHINDSKGLAGDHLDRHENIGKGTIGKEGLRRIMNCDHFKDIPLILETPWTDNAGYAKEIKILKSLIHK